METQDSGVSVRSWVSVGPLGLWQAHHLDCYLQEIAAQVSAEVLGGLDG